VSLAICFDSCFPSVMRQSAREGNPDFMVLPSLDPDTPGGVCQSLHGAYTAFSAASVGLPILRSETTSHAQIFDARGRLWAQTGGQGDQFVVAGIRPVRRWTLHTYAGDWFLVVCAALAVWPRGRDR
jgi:apolipoprotein N-acyltransferase